MCESPHCDSFLPVWPPVPNASAMKKQPRKTTTRAVRETPTPDDVLDEYDFTHARKNPYAGRVVTGGLLVVVDADLVAAFPTSEAVNAALRVIASAAARLQFSIVDRHDTGDKNR